MNGHSYAPWTNEEVAALNAWQRSRAVHPFTCGKRDRGHPYETEYGDHGVLRATNAGWVCAYCDYTQGWCHSMMLEPPPPVLTLADILGPDNESVTRSLYDDDPHVNPQAETRLWTPEGTNDHGNDGTA